MKVNNNIVIVDKAEKNNNGKIQTADRFTSKKQRKKPFRDVFADIAVRGSTRSNVTFKIDLSLPFVIFNCFCLFDLILYVPVLCCYNRTMQKTSIVFPRKKQMSTPFRNKTNHKIAFS